LAGSFRLNAGASVQSVAPSPVAAHQTKQGTTYRKEHVPADDVGELYQGSKRMTFMGPIAHTDGHDRPRLFDDAVPSLAGRIDDLLVGFEDTVGEVGLSQELPEVLDGI
jgi:hypothetical protein